MPEPLPSPSSAAAHEDYLRVKALQRGLCVSACVSVLIFASCLGAVPVRGLGQQQLPLIAQTHTQGAAFTTQGPLKARIER